MSLQEREKAKDLIARALMHFYDARLDHSYDRYLHVGNFILNTLLKNGYLNDKTLVGLQEIEDKIENAAFKCKVE